MALQNLTEKIILGSDWIKVDLENLNSFYLIGIKEIKGTEDTIDPKNVKRIGFEVGIESGIAKKYLTISHVNLDFDAITSNDKDLNEKTAMARYLNFPSIFYIRPIEIYTENERFTSGITNIDVNINTLKLN